MESEQRKWLSDLLSNPRENLGVELKQWLNPGELEGIAKIAKASIALRNNNGGVLIIGIMDDGYPDFESVPDNPRLIFHSDTVQEIVSKYSSQQFEVTTQFVERDGIEFPVIQIPSGVRTPVACKKDLLDSKGENLLNVYAVYIRTLNSNNTVSSSPARWNDWEDISRNCFDNREADIGAFVRRHLSGLDLNQLMEAFSDSEQSRIKQLDATEYLDEGYKRFQKRMSKRSLSLPDKLGTCETAVIVSGEFEKSAPTEDFLRLLQQRKLRLSGWSPWIDSLTAADKNDRPYVLDDGWEALFYLSQQDVLGPSLDFWRIDTKGMFYCLRGIDDDLLRGNEEIKPFEHLDFPILIYRVTEVFAAAMSFAQSMGFVPDDTFLSIALRLKNLTDRTLSTWSDSRRFFRTRGIAQQNEVTSTTLIPLVTPLNAITPFVEEILQPVFALFDGKKFDSKIYEDIIKKVISRRF